MPSASSIRTGLSEIETNPEFESRYALKIGTCAITRISAFISAGSENVLATISMGSDGFGPVMRRLSTSADGNTSL